MTPLAEAVLTELKTGRKGFKAHALATTISEKLGRTIAPNSIYRVLRQMENDGYVSRIVSKNVFVALSALRDDAPCILICSTCGQIGMTSCDGVETILKQLCNSVGFIPRTFVIEVNSECPACRLILIGTDQGIATRAK
jgi:Fur family transcriptional regulator, zinc uptake regulator